MRLPRPPDWLLYAAVVGGLLYVAVTRQEHVLPPSPTPAPARQAPDGAVIGPASPFDPSVAVDVPEHPGPSAGTAFSVASSGIWVTARHVVDGCRQAALVVGDGRLVDKPYGRLLWQGLPPFARTRDVDVALDFLGHPPGRAEPAAQDAARA